MLLSRLVGLLERNVGTSAWLPTHAIECELPAKLFRALNIDGYCVSRGQIGQFVASVYPTVCNSVLALRTLRSFLQHVDSADPSITHVVIYTSKPRTRGTTKWLERAAIHRSLVNHERIHAETMTRSHVWHVTADGMLENKLSELWTAPRNAMLKMPTYASIITRIGDESWVSTTEMIARIGAILHAPKQHRKAIAAYQLDCAIDEILSLAAAVEERWGTAEALIGWIDARYGS